jgi:hypothetical protein
MCAGGRGARQNIKPENRKEYPPSPLIMHKSIKDMRRRKEEENGLKDKEEKTKSRRRKEYTMVGLNLQPLTNKASIGRKAALGLRHIAGLMPPSPSSLASAGSAHVARGMTSAVRLRLVFVKRCPKYLR